MVIKNHKRILEPKWLLVSVFFVAGVFLGALGLYIFLGLNAGVVRIHPSSDGYAYTNPTIAVESSATNIFSINRAIELVIKGVISDAKKNEQITDASVYYRDMDSGEWVGVNENAKFSAGKLLKIPIMIAYYRIAENDPEVLNKEFLDTYHSPEKSSGVATKSPVVFGQTYSTEYLIRSMIVDGNDEATNVLFDNIDKNVLNEVFSDLGVDFIENQKNPDYIALKLYSLFFRVLYNATYLSREYSEKALILLDEVNDSNGINAGVPKDAPFSRRFGVNTITENGTALAQMYDCGIVYYPAHPYMLCVLAKSHNEPMMQSFFKTLSEKVYTETKYKYKGK